MLFLFVMAMGLTVALIFLVRPLAVGAGLVDAPCVRKRHDGVVPLIGGIVIYAALAITAVFFACWGAREGLGLVVLGMPILLVGMADDRWSLSASVRFLVEIVCCLLAARYYGIYIESLGGLLPGTELRLGWMALPVTVVGLVGVINAFNMTDGVDGLAGGLAMLIFGSLAFLAYHADADVALQLISLVASLLGFLIFNSRFFGRGRAAIFMGDGGTLFVGFALGWYLILLSQGEHAVIRPVDALWLFAVPLLDTMSVMIRRIRRRQSPFHADREHLHHIFLLAGFGVNRTVLIILGFQSIFIAFAMASRHYAVPDWVSFWLFIALFFFYYWCMSHAWKLMKRIRSFREWAGFEDRRLADQQSAAGRRSSSDRRESATGFYGLDRRAASDRRTADDRRGESRRS